MNTTHPAPTETDEMTRGAYRYLVLNTGNAWVGLADLRAMLPHLERAELDESLRRLARNGEATLAPESNQKGLTREDRAAALQLGGEAKHLVRMG